MHISFPRFRIRKKSDTTLQPSTDELSSETSVAITLTSNMKILERYSIIEPHARIIIAQDPQTGTIMYIVDELKLNKIEKNVYNRIIDTLRWELNPPEENIDPKEYFEKEARKVIERYKLSLGSLPGVAWNKIVYYVERDILGYERLDPIMRDPNIEDISCNGPERPVYVWHRKYESIPTNVVFETSEELDNFILRLAYKAGKHISTAHPVLDAMLPENHRVAATFMTEVSRGGSSFTIRKFREDPITIVDMVRSNVMSPEMAAYLWMLMENKFPAIVMGVTGAGKTTMLNALACLFRPTIKVVSIEDTPELRLPLENWVQLMSRPSYGFGPEKVGEITLYDLVKVSLRYRPDVIIVGEIRGEEAYVLFQAMATGHGGMTTLHSESIDAAVKRLISPPMNIPPSYIPLIKVALVIKRAKLRKAERSVRRVTEVIEVLDYNKYLTVFKWDPFTDTFINNWSESVNLRDIGEFLGMTQKQMMDELIKRRNIILWMSENNIRKYTDVAKIVNKYYTGEIVA